MPTKTITKKAATTSKVPAKTVAKKSSTKKTATKKSTEKTPNFKAMVCAADGECFWTHDGRILQNLEDLHMAFGSMDEEVFLHHVSTEKNDFADWVEHVLADLDCSVQLRTAQKVEDAQKLMAAHIAQYHSN